MCVCISESTGKTCRSLTSVQKPTPDTGQDWLLCGNASWKAPERRFSDSTKGLVTGNILIENHGSHH